jgi:hypothetical protein
MKKLFKISLASIIPLVSLFLFFSFSVLPCLALEYAPPLGTTDLKVVIAKVISAVLGIVGSLALLMFFLGGILWLTAAGNDDRIKLSKAIIVWSTLGLAVIFSAYAIAKLIMTAILQGST